MPSIRSNKVKLNAYSETCLKGPLKNRQNKGLKDRVFLSAVAQW